MDVFTYKKKISDEYYLIESESRFGLALYYKTGNGDFIGRVPPRVLEVRLNDSFLVAKCDRQSSIVYYIIDRDKDTDYAEDSVFVLAKGISEHEYGGKWEEKVGIKFSKPK